VKINDVFVVLPFLLLVVETPPTRCVPGVQTPSVLARVSLFDHHHEHGQHLNVEPGWKRRPRRLPRKQRDAPS
jgi:hypothetical protein